MDSIPPVKSVANGDVTETAPGNAPGLLRLFRAARQIHEREKNRIRAEIAHIPGLMALLMKPRNGLKWTREERQELRVKLRGLSRLSVYLLMAALPFTSFTLPLVAWWLDRRHQKRGGGKSAPQ